MLSLKPEPEKVKLKLVGVSTKPEMVTARDGFEIANAARQRDPNNSLRGRGKHVVRNWNFILGELKLPVPACRTPDCGTHGMPPEGQRYPHRRKCLADWLDFKRCLRIRHQSLACHPDLPARCRA